MLIGKWSRDSPFQRQMTVRYFAIKENTHVRVVILMLIGMVILVSVNSPRDMLHTKWHCHLLVSKSNLAKCFLLKSQKILHLGLLFRKLYGLQDSYRVLKVVLHVTYRVFFHCDSMVALIYVKDNIMGGLSTKRLVITTFKIYLHKRKSS